MFVIIAFADIIPQRKENTIHSNRPCCLVVGFTAKCRCFHHILLGVDASMRRKIAGLLIAASDAGSVGSFEKNGGGIAKEVVMKDFAGAEDKIGI